jgi:hypothetical protein
LKVVKNIAKVTVIEYCKTRWSAENIPFEKSVIGRKYSVWKWWNQQI